MRFHQFDLNLLVYLEALLAEKSVSKAAASVFISQSAMSLALSRLRQHFGDDLLVQVAGRKMVLTPLAESLAEPVRDILLQMQSVATATVDFDPSKSSRKFTIMASDYAVDVLLKRVVTQLFQKAPGIRIAVRRLVTTSSEEMKRPEVDLLIAPGSAVSEDLPSEPLWEDTMTCIVWSRNHAVGAEISLEQYVKMGHVCNMMDGHTPPDHERWFLNTFGSTRKVEVVVPDFGMVCQMIEGTNRIATVHLRQAKLYAKQFSLRLVKPPVEYPRFIELVQWHRHQERDSALLWLRGFLKSVAAEI
jgi:LysR family nod box-dependent transcriptional activator